MNSRLMWVSESKGLLASEHFDITKTRSIRNHLVRFDSYICNAFAKKKKKDVIADFSDLEKAYDTTWKHGILHDFEAIYRYRWVSTQPTVPVENWVRSV